MVNNVRNILFISKKYGTETQDLAMHFNVTNKDCFSFTSYDDIELKIDKKIDISLNGKNIKSYNLIYQRSGQREKFDISTILGLYCDHENIKNVNSIYKKEIFGSKLLQMVILSLNRILVPKTLYIPRVNIDRKINFIKRNLELPLVMKSINSHKGQNNYLINEYKEITTLLLEDKDKQNEYIFQEFIPNDFDYRILVLGQKSIGSVEKRIRDKDANTHKNNVSVGASEEFLNIKEIPKKLKLIALETSKVMNIEICGVDIIHSKHTNHYYVLEANPSPGITLGSDEERSLYNYILENIK